MSSRLAKLDSLVTKKHQIKDSQTKDKLQIEKFEKDLCKLKAEKEEVETRIKESEDKISKIRQKQRQLKQQLQETKSDSSESAQEEPKAQPKKPLKSCMKKPAAPAKPAEKQSKTKLRKRKHTTSIEEEEQKIKA